MGIYRLLSHLLFACLLLWPGLSQAQVEDTEAQQLLTELAEASFAAKKDVVNRIASSGDERARGWLESFSSNKLARIESSGQFIIVLENRGRDWTIESALTGENLGEMSRRDIDTIRVNNALRNEIEGILSVIDLKSPDEGNRLSAARALKGSVSGTLAERLPELIKTEESESVQAALTEALAIYNVEEQGDVAAVATLSGSLNSEARAALQQAMRSDDAALVAAATKAMASIEQKLKLNRAAETLYFGLSLGSVLMLAAIGLAITFGVMGVINMAHGELIMLGAYTTWGMQQ
ncbi:MAG: urea ABC transporter permease subunit UrtB, partial [Marinobacter sp.]|nr:urea ABC transporter permease subunit UrtB [Marinobacter sp.]